MFKVDIVSTGSEGNCVVINDEIMIDAGISKKKIKEYGIDLDKIKYLFITHRHSDHANLATIRYFITNNVEVHVPFSVRAKLMNENRIKVNNYPNLIIHEGFNNDYGIHRYTCGTYNITLYPTKHYDIINYAIIIERDNQRLLYATDLQTVEPTEISEGLSNLGTFNTIIMEGNYDEVYLRAFINNSINYIDPNLDGSVLNDDELDKWVRQNYKGLPNDVSHGMFRAVQNMRHLSKQQARIYVKNHLRQNGRYYEVHRSSMFYEKKNKWESLSEIW